MRSKGLRGGWCIGSETLLSSEDVMVRSSRFMWLMALIAILFLGAAFITLRAAERARATSQELLRPSPTPPSRPAPSALPTPAPTAHPPPSAPEESATITDDPTVAPDAAEPADNNVSFPSDI